jgi:3'(2'), 5'-bisphosphate nucleotidase
LFDPHADLIRRHGGGAMQPDPDRLLRLVREAGTAILELYRDGSTAVEAKADGSPLTAADLSSHRILSAGLTRLSNLPVLSEEQPVDYAQREPWREFWLVDPLDGTKDFLAHNDEFTVNIALIRDTQPVIGIVYAPALDELYFADRDAGAFQVRAGEWLRLPLARHWPERRMAISRFHDVPATAEFARVNGFDRSERIGSALKFGRLARGDVAVYPRFTGSMEWDIAAGHCLLEAAGCSIVDLITGVSPRYNKPDLLNNAFIAVAPSIDFSGLKLPDLPVS